MASSTHDKLADAMSYISRLEEALERRDSEIEMLARDLRDELDGMMSRVDSAECKAESALEKAEEAVDVAGDAVERSQGAVMTANLAYQAAEDAKRNT